MTAMSIFTLNDYKSAVSDLLRGTYVKDEDRTEVEEETLDLILIQEFRQNMKETVLCSVHLEQEKVIN